MAVVVVLFFSQLIGAADANTIVRFLDLGEQLAVLVNGVPQPGNPNFLQQAPTPQTAQVSAPVGSGEFTRFCPTCPTAILTGVVLFEPRSNDVSDFVMALVIASPGFMPGFVDTQFFFESDPNVLFFANNPPAVRAEAALLQSLVAKALAGTIPKLEEDGTEITLSDPDTNTNLFRDVNGALVPLPTNVLGNGFVVKAASDVDPVPEPATVLLLAVSLLALYGIARSQVRFRR
jgi:hypothetical protein